MPETKKTKRKVRSSTPVEPLEMVDRTLDRCPKCGSTEIASRNGHKLRNRRELVAGSGVDRDGKPATHVILHDAVCGNCGQRRVIRTFENRIAKK